MEKVNRGHLAVLEFVKTQLCFDYQDEEIINNLIAQASAAPEQEAVGWLTPSGGFYREKKIAESGRYGHVCKVTPVYTHADPSEVERLRAENKRLDLAMAQADHSYDCDRYQLHQQLIEAKALLRDWNRIGDMMPKLSKRTSAFLSTTTQPSKPEPEPEPEQLRSYELTVGAAEVLRQQLNQAQALLREAQAIMGRVLVKEWLSPNCPLHNRINAFLSATAQSAEVKS